MADNYLRIYVHFVWTTWRRTPFLTPEVEGIVYPCVRSECKGLRVTPLAVGGVEDHIHVVASLNSTCTIAHLVKQMKGSSSHLVSHVESGGYMFGWQEGYGAISVDSSNLDQVIRYVLGQKEHHKNNTLWPEFEKFDDPNRRFQRESGSQDATSF